MTKNSFQEKFQPSTNLPSGLVIPQRADIITKLNTYGIQTVEEIRLVDTSQGTSDIRLNYIIDNTWVLRFCNAHHMTESRLCELHRLIQRYRTMNILCPQYIRNLEGNFLQRWNEWVCYLSEYIDLPLAVDADLQHEERLIAEIHASVAHFANMYKGVDLSSTPGMYSLFDLSPFDLPNGIDEKESNFKQLITLLKIEKENHLAKLLIDRHSAIRQKLKSVYRGLPRCVFQGDENFSNILIDANEHFVGFIDFNLAGTEVIVNHFANLVGFDYYENQTEPVGSQTRLEYAVDTFNRQATKLLRVYSPTEDEIRAMRQYALIVMLAQWPILCYFHDGLNSPLRDDILGLLALIAVMPEDCLLPDIK